MRERRAERTWRYVDLGTAKGFEADLTFGEEGIVKRYQHLFEAFDHRACTMGRCLTLARRRANTREWLN